jgi:hypothetical protein
MEINKFKLLSRLEQGRYLYETISHAAKLMGSIELEGEETEVFAREVAEQCGWSFCDHCDQLTERRDCFGFCDKCADESEKWEREQYDLELDVQREKVNFFNYRG